MTKLEDLKRRIENIDFAVAQMVLNRLATVQDSPQGTILIWNAKDKDFFNRLVANREKLAKEAWQEEMSNKYKKEA